MDSLALTLLFVAAGLAVVGFIFIWVTPADAPKKVSIELAVDDQAAAKTKRQIDRMHCEVDRMFGEDSVEERLATLYTMKLRAETAAYKAEAEVSRLRALIHEQADFHTRGRDKLAELFEQHSKLAHWIQDDRDAAEKQVEQFQVQMAGVSVAAFGGTKNPATRGMYGWSVPYQDVLNLRLKYEVLQAALRDIRKEPICQSDRAHIYYLRAMAQTALSTVDGDA